MYVPLVTPFVLLVDEKSRMRKGPYNIHVVISEHISS